MKTAALVMLASFCLGCQSPSPRDYPLQALPFTQIKLEDNFWAPRLHTNRAVTLPHCIAKVAEEGALHNLELAARRKAGEQLGVYPFLDSDVYKTLEGASYLLREQYDRQLEQRLDEWIALIAEAQEEDGYLYTPRTNNAKRLANWAGKERWSFLERSHELYNVGHLYEAAVAHFETTGKRTLLDIATKNADLLLKTFGPEKLQLPPGHQEVEIGLVKLARATGNMKYAELANFFLEQRGHLRGRTKDWGTYAQDHQPILAQDEAVGHAVRQAYMNMGMLDVAAHASSRAYASASLRLWENVVRKKLYLTGRIGAVGMGERFSDNYDLPNMSGYSETCSAIGNVLWNHRMFLYYGEGKYIDVLERTLYNALLSGLDQSGDRFFYDNPLASNGQHQRSEWFTCACCPTNLLRPLPQVPSMMYARRGEEVFVNLYAQSRATITFGEQKLVLRQETDYPWHGHVRVRVDSGAANATLHLRIPGWARNEVVPSDLYRFVDSRNAPITLAVNGEAVALRIANGYARVERDWKVGDVLELNLPMPIRRVVAHAQVNADTGRVALQRGPLVYCAEGPDNQDGHVLNLRVPIESELQFVWREDLLRGVGTITGEARSVAYVGAEKALRQVAQPFTAIPYYAWSYRGRAEMAVWLAQSNEAARPLHGPTLAQTSRVTSSSGENAVLLNQERTPRSSRDVAAGAFTWTMARDTAWVQYDFLRTEEVSQVEVYWLHDKEARPPKSWRVLAKVGESWNPVWSATNVWGTESDRFNKVIFETVRTNAVRLETVLPANATSGVLAWKVY